MARSRDTPTSRRRGLIIAGGVLAVLAIAGAGVSLGTLLTPTHHDTAAGRGGASSRPTTSSRPTPRVVVDGGSLCGLPGLDPAGTTLTAAPAATWSTVGLMAAPSSPVAGPGKSQSDGLRWCYAHTAEGAVFAAMNFWAEGSDPRLFQGLLQHSVEAGPGRDAAAAAQHAPSDTGLSAQFDAFQLTTYTPTAATVDVVALFSSGRQISFPTPVTWQDGDWRVALSSTGGNLYPAAVLTSLDGYTPWSGTP